MPPTPDTKEDISSKIPAIKTLMALGWQYLPPSECLKKRGTNREVLLKDELIEHLKKQTFHYKGNEEFLSTNAIDQILREISAPGLNEGLLTANEKIYDKLCLGITVTEFIEGKKHQPTIPLIDWDKPENNTYQVTEELEVLSTNGTHTRRPDIVCFINGIPFVVIEAKRLDSGNPNKNSIDESISQTIRNQKNEEILQLFVYAQLLLAINNTEGRYGTTKTPKKFWTHWCEEIFDETYFAEIKNSTLDEQQNYELLKVREVQATYFTQLDSKQQLSNDQDRLLISLLNHKRILEFVRSYLLFDKKHGKIATRYQQYFATKALVKRIKDRHIDGNREGGVIWHTTGSGKSYTMVLLTKALLLEPSLKDSRVILVTDRIDLEKQLARTFLSSGVFDSSITTSQDGSQARVKTGKDLAKRIGRGSERIIFSIINKFNTASKQPECYNPSDKIIVLIDEGHRSQSGENHERMRKALPNAVFIAFIGTPLLKNDKTTNKFGSIIHAYTMQRAVEDEVVAPLLYEERKPILSINDKAIDNWFDHLTATLSAQQRQDLKHKYSRKNVICEAENRQELIAWDISDHFNEHFKKFGHGMKGQLATSSKAAAMRYQQLLDDIGIVSSAVIISPPDTHEGHESVDESTLSQVQQWWKDNVGNNQEAYEQEQLENFAGSGSPDLLIVVDKLLTGFDEPRNAVLYIDKPLKEHNLVQAIARVNRLHEHKAHGLLIDYRGILKELDTAIAEYQDLEKRTQGGYDIDDLRGLYAQVSTEYKRLPSLHDKLWSLFAGVENEQDLEQYRQVLIPKYTRDDDGHDYDIRQHVREDFYQALTDFGLCLKVALSSRSFFEDGSFNEGLIKTYKKDLHFFTRLKKIAKQDAQETVDYSSYDEQIRRLVDKYVVGENIADSDGAISVNDMGQSKPQEWSEEKARNETDIIKTRIKKTIKQNLVNDPYAQKVFLERLKQIIHEAESLFDDPYKQYILFDDLEDKIKNRDLDQNNNSVHHDFGGNCRAQVYFDIFKLMLGNDAFYTFSDSKIQSLVVEAYKLDDIVENAVAEHSLNPQNIESQISKQALPRLFGLIGLDKAKAVIGKIIETIRIGYSS